MCILRVKEFYKLVCSIPGLSVGRSVCEVSTCLPEFQCFICTPDLTELTHLTGNLMKVLTLRQKLATESPFLRTIAEWVSNRNLTYNSSYSLFSVVDERSRLRVVTHRNIITFDPRVR